MSDVPAGPRSTAHPDPQAAPRPPAMPIGVRLWFVWAFALLAGTGILLPRIIAFVDFSEKAPFSLLGIFMMAELAALLFAITVAMQRKRIAFRFAIGIAVLAAPLLAGLPPILLDFPPAAAAGWQALFIPVGLLITIVLIFGLLRPASRDYFSEE
jgi:cytochrome c oxidase subunit IV